MQIQGHGFHSGEWLRYQGCKPARYPKNWHKHDLLAQEQRLAAFPHPLPTSDRIAANDVRQDADSNPGLLAKLKRIFPDCLTGSHTEPLALLERKRLFRMRLDRGSDYVRCL